MFLFDNKLERLAAELRNAKNIPIDIQLWNGKTYTLGEQPTVTIKVPKARSLSYLISPDLMKLGEAYVEGHIEVEGRLADIFNAGEQLARSAAGGSRVAGLKRMVTHTRSRDRKAIQYHYDVSNEFYSLFLDPNMVYSCAYFGSDADSLARAQERKLDHILTKLQVKPGDRFLDVGCGWGALIIRAAKKFGATATGITLSENQYALAKERIKAEGLEDRCEVRIQDYRDVPGQGVYDKIASVGMFEHVGLKNLPAYFRKMHSLLADDGVALNHGITSADPESGVVGMGAGDFIDRYVFPDGELPHISLVTKEMSAAGFEVADIESLRRHYARTCAIWADGLERNKDRAVAIAGDRRYRIWSLYLIGCAHAFANNWINIYQVLATKDGGVGANPLPMTRDYMYRAS
jgi:cyclopropane-fatty-acyl-phospholipid synthase